MDPGTVVKLLTILLAPTAVATVVLWTPRLVRALLHGLRRPEHDLVPVGPPVERSAASLRRLLAEHEAVRSSRDVAVRASRLAALEGALTDVALEAARALQLDVPERRGRAPLPREQLRRLLAELADAGLVLPAHERFGR